MRLGLCGGTFDPVHYGHLLLAEACREQCRLDEVWFVPTSDPPHKPSGSITSGSIRSEMLELAVGGHAAFRVSDIELRRSGTTFTVETLRELHNRAPEDELFFLIGADSLADLPHWREPLEIARLATIVAVNRGNEPLVDKMTLTRELEPEIASRIQLVSMPGVAISATDVRNRVRNRRSIRFMVPRGVEEYIVAKGLYATRDVSD